MGVETKDIKSGAIELLKTLIRTPSLSREESRAADIIESFLKDQGVSTSRKHNNILAFNRHFDPQLPVILLNSHHDTVKPATQWTYDPYGAIVEGDRLIGLGSNDAGGALVSLIAVFLNYYDTSALKYNFILAATAEEEITGDKGISSVLPELPVIDFAIVGEPTGMDIAVAEKGLMVVDCRAKGTAGHAARSGDDNAIMNALDDIRWFHDFRFEKVSDHLGAVKMTPTIIHAGTTHNVVPGTCEFTVDIRTNEHYSNEEVLEIIRSHVKCEVTPRSTRLQPSFIDEGHPLVKAAVRAGCKTFGSPTLSDQALMDFPSAKIGPGQSERSHTADEFILLSEIKDGIDRYIKILDQILIA